MFIVAIGCTPAGGVDQTTPRDKAAPGPIEISTPPTPPTPPTPSADQCESKIAEYLERRSALDGCERDSDCAEMWAGLCPHGPYFINRASDPSAVLTLSREIQAGCQIPECEPPAHLDPGRCEAGRCVEGRQPPKSDEFSSCWDFRITYLEAEGRVDARSVEHQRGVTPRLATGVTSIGSIVLEVDWKGCLDCELRISEHNSGMARLVDGTRTRSETKETIEFPVTPGPYFFLARSPTGDHGYSLSLHMLDSSGAPGKANLHGVAWQRMCED